MGSMDTRYTLDNNLTKKYGKPEISRIDMVKSAMENILDSLLKKSPKVKVGLVSFGTNVEAKGDCLSKSIILDCLNNEAKIKEIGLNNNNIIGAPIKKSFNNLKTTLRNIVTRGCTALGPAVLLSLYLLNNSKMGSRIFLCTDGESNSGIGDISSNRQNAINFYTKIGNLAKEKGIVISLITFKDSKSSISILKHMVEPTGGIFLKLILMIFLMSLMIS